MLEAPPGLRYVWLGLVVLVALEAAYEIGWIGGPGSLYRLWFHDIVLAAAAALMVARARFEPVARRAWLAFGTATAVWWLGTVLWSIVYGDKAHPPYPTFADAFWLLWYPLMVLGIASLIRIRVRAFELHRWMDGIAVTLIVLAAGFAFIVQPVAEDSAQSWTATAVDFSYPVLDVLLIGAVLGVYGLLGWKPDGMWILIGAGILVMAIADAAFAVGEARGTAESGHYDYVWTVGALLLAYAAWVRPPVDQSGRAQVTGMRAIALALIAQALAIGIQVYATFHEVARSERVVTVIVLIVASVQLILNRPRAPAARPDQGLPVNAPDPATGLAGSAEPVLPVAGESSGSPPPSE